MSNITEQIFLNKGYKPVDQTIMSVTTTAAAITAPAAACNAIMIRCPNNLNGGDRIFLGSSTVTTANGFPLHGYSGVTLQTTETIFIVTNTPTLYYLISNILAGSAVSILYLAVNT